jgi:DNA-directed RNA polymerase subunit beta'
MGRAETPSPRPDTVRLRLAGPDDILAWSSGEVTVPATFHPRSGKPIRGGLFCERIFGPVQDWRCHCGRYDGPAHKGQTCERCGTPVLHRRARRSRMGHIELAAPVVHVWFFKGRPSPLAALLGLRPGQVEQIVHGCAYVVLQPGTGPLPAGRFLDRDEYLEARERYGPGFEAGTGAAVVRQLLGRLDLADLAATLRARLLGLGPEAPDASRKALLRRLRLVEALRAGGAPAEWLVLTRLPVIPPGLRPAVRLPSGKLAVNELNELYRRVIRRNNRLRRSLETGAPACIVQQEQILLQRAVDALLDNVRSGRPVRGRFQRALRSLSDLLGGKQGRFRANLLGKRVDYSARAVIVVGPELQLHQCGLPRTIALKLYEPFLVRRLLQRGQARTVGKARQLLHELAHPALVARTARLVVRTLSQELAGELDTPRARRAAEGVLSELPADAVVQVRAILKLQGPTAARAEVCRLLQARQAAAWALVEEVTAHHPVLLNRAPTLHRMGIQAFEPVLVEGHAIRLHPLVCKGFNADFDGDQMAVHLPLSVEARVEAATLLTAGDNLFNPANGQLGLSPSQDIVMGCHYLTVALPAQRGRLPTGPTKAAVPAPSEFVPPDTTRGEGAAFACPAEVLLAHALGKVGTHARIHLRLPVGRPVVDEGQEEQALPHGGRVRTTVGRVLFDAALPAGLPFYNLTLTGKRLGRILTDCYRLLGRRAAVALVDRIKRVGFQAAGRSGLSFATDDVPVPPDKDAVLRPAERRVEGLRAAFARGNLDEDEYALRVLELWTEAQKQVTARLLPDLRHDTRAGRPYLNPLFVQIDSGARGSLDQLRQLAGMRGLMASVSGKLIERPITASLREGLPSWDYFLSAHGARKGLTDKGVRTAEAGYLMRKLIDAAQAVVVRASSCFTHRGVVKRAPEPEQKGAPPLSVLVRGRVSRHTITGPGGEVVVRENEVISPEQARALEALGLREVWVRSPLTCEAEGVCRLCYGTDLATGALVEEGMAVGILAAQSIGEPGTQLTLHTFRLGGLAGKDIANDLERVSRLLEATPPQQPATLAPLAGLVRVEEAPGGGRVLVIEPVAGPGCRVSVPAGRGLAVRPGERVAVGTALTDGAVDPRALLEVAGVEAAQDYLLGEVRRIYRHHGLEIDDRHFEVILARLFGHVQVTDPGDTALLPGQVLARRAFAAGNRPRRDAAPGAFRVGLPAPARCRPYLLGLTRVAAGADGFLAAASFQRAVEVLTTAALAGQGDELAGLKESVMLGRPIPAGTGQPRLRQARVRQRRPRAVPALVKEDA